MEVDYVTDEVKALIGKEAPQVEAVHPVEAGEVRRFFHATMDENPNYWDGERAKASRYGGPVAPLGFPVHAFRRSPDAPDPIGAHDNPDFDGKARRFRPGLPPLPIPLSGVLNGGYEYEFYRYARHGEKVFRRSSYRDIYQRPGKNGPMVFVILEDLFVDENGKPFLKALNTSIMR